MPYTTFATEEIIRMHEQEKNALLTMLMRHPELSQESILKLSEPLKLMEAELKKRGEMPVE